MTARAALAAPRTKYARKRTQRAPHPPQHERLDHGVQHRPGPERLDRNAHARIGLLERVGDPAPDAVVRQHFLVRRVPAVDPTLDEAQRPPLQFRALDD